MRWMRCCLNPKVMAGLGVVALASWLLAPATAAAVVPLLIGLICPLSMGVMMWQMRKGGSRRSAVPAEQDTDVEAQLSAMREELAIARARRQLRGAEPPPIG
jgi:hypothetical protein